MRILILTAWLFLGLLIGSSPAQAPRNIILPSGTKAIKTLSQNWTDEEADEFYHAPQGSQLIPLKWFLSLEQPNSETLFLDPAFVQSFGFIPRNKGTAHNADGLPIGFSYEGKFVGVTCAACHSAQIKFEDKAWLVDGAPTGGDFERLMIALIDSMGNTLSDSFKFDRFARRVLGTSASETDRQKLRAELTVSHLDRKAYNAMNLSRHSNARFGPGRVDAFGAILNQVTANFAKVPSNAIEANAPVSFPCLWDAPQHDRVQWSGAAENKVSPLLEPIIGTKHFGALGRNIGEVLGVFGNLDATSEGSVLQLKGYQSSANKQSLIQIEESLRKLWSPKWPEDVWHIDQELAAKGKAIYAQDCRRCHEDVKFRRDDPNRQVEAKMEDVKTDTQFYLNFIQPAKTGILAGRVIGFKPTERFGNVSSRGLMLKHMVQRTLFYRDSPFPAEIANPLEYLEKNATNSEFDIFANIKIGDLTISGAFDSLNIEDGINNLASSKTVDFIESTGSRVRGELKSLINERFPSLLNRLANSTADAPTPSDPRDSVAFKYKGRPLNGIWATAPYLHNGSVQNLDDLLKLAAKRKKTFHLGSGQFDPVLIGFQDSGDFLFDASVIGNSNIGHDSFYSREYSTDERKTLIEYMKTL